MGSFISKTPPELVQLAVGCNASTGGVFPSGMSWSLLAWGFEGGGRDLLDPAFFAAVTVDLDDIDSITSQKANGKKVICYFSVGTLETFRPDHQDAWLDYTVGNLDQFDEPWLDINQLVELQAIMGPRFERAASQGCDAVEPDNVDCYQNEDCGITGSAAEKKQAQLAYNRWQVSKAHELGLAIGLKNSVELIPKLVTDYDFAVNENCWRFAECDQYAPFRKADKAVFAIEYLIPTGCCGAVASVNCDNAEKLGLSQKYCVSSKEDDGLCVSGDLESCFGPAC